MTPKIDVIHIGLAESNFSLLNRHLLDEGGELLMRFSIESEFAKYLDGVKKSILSCSLSFEIKGVTDEVKADSEIEDKDMIFELECVFDGDFYLEKEDGDKFNSDEDFRNSITETLANSIFAVQRIHVCQSLQFMGDASAEVALPWTIDFSQLQSGDMVKNNAKNKKN